MEAGVIGIILVVRLIFGAIASAIANSKGRSAVGWFFGGFFLDIIGIIVVAVLPNLNEQRARDERADRENRRLREQLRQERMKVEAFRQHTTARLDAHDEHMGMDTRSLAAPQSNMVQLEADPQARGVNDNLVAALEGLDAPTTGNWYYEQSGASKGPITRAALIQLMEDGTVGPHTLLWNDSMDDWKAAYQIGQFRTYLAGHQ